MQRWIRGSLLAAATIGGSACGAPDAVMLEVDGRVQGYGEAWGIPNATVELLGEDGEIVGEGSTDSLGDFEILYVADYDDGTVVTGRVTADGYVGATFRQELRLLRAGQAAFGATPGHRTDPFEFTLPAITLAPDSDATGDITGVVFDALVQDQAAGLSGLSIDLREGIGATTDGEVLASAVSGDLGFYVVEGCAAGTYTAFLDGGGTYLDTTATVVCRGGETTSQQNIGTTPALAPGEFRVVLAWSETPEDLDSHLTGPADEGGRFHVYFAEPSYPKGTIATTSTAFLDVDDTTSFGPETVTVHRRVDGTRYRYSVHDYTNRASATSAAMSGSRAYVRLFLDDGRGFTFDVPAGRNGTVWTVFELDETGPYWVNTFTSTEDPADELVF